MISYIISFNVSCYCNLKRNTRLMQRSRIISLLWNVEEAPLYKYMFYRGGINTHYHCDSCVRIMRVGCPPDELRPYSVIAIG